MTLLVAIGKIKNKSSNIKKIPKVLFKSCLCMLRFLYFQRLYQSVQQRFLLILLSYFIVFEAQVCVRLLNEIFGNWLNDEAFFTWLAKIFCIRPSKFCQYVLKWTEMSREMNFEKSGVETKLQLIHKIKFTMYGLLKFVLSPLMAEMVKIKLMFLRNSSFKSMDKFKVT